MPKHDERIRTVCVFRENVAKRIHHIKRMLQEAAGHRQMKPGTGRCRVKIRGLTVFQQLVSTFSFDFLDFRFKTFDIRHCVHAVIPLYGIYSGYYILSQIFLSEIV